MCEIKKCDYCHSIKIRTGTFYQKERRVTIKRLRDAGMTLQQIGSEMGISHQRVQQILKRIETEK